MKVALLNKNRNFDNLFAVQILARYQRQTILWSYPRPKRTCNKSDSLHFVPDKVAKTLSEQLGVNPDPFFMVVQRVFGIWYRYLEALRFLRTLLLDILVKRIRILKILSTLCIQAMKKVLNKNKWQQNSKSLIGFAVKTKFGRTDYWCSPHLQTLIRTPLKNIFTWW